MVRCHWTSLCAAVQYFGPATSRALRHPTQELQHAFEGLLQHSSSAQLKLLQEEAKQELCATGGILSITWHADLACQAVGLPH